MRTEGANEMSELEVSRAIHNGGGWRVSEAKENSTAGQKVFGVYW